MRKIAFIALLIGFQITSASADCDPTKILYGRTILMVAKSKGQYFKEIVVGQEDANRNHVLGYIEGPERDDSRLVRNANGEWCFVIEYRNKYLTFEDTCKSCPRIPTRLKKTAKGYIVLQDDGKILGSIDGFLSD